MLKQDVIRVVIARGPRTAGFPRSTTSAPTPATITWRETFNRLDFGTSHPFVETFVKQNTYVDSRPIPAIDDEIDPPDRASYFDGTVPDLPSLLALLAERRAAGQTTDIGFAGGPAALRKRDRQALEPRDWKWRDPTTNTGRHQARNWIGADAFERIVDELPSAPEID